MKRFCLYIIMAVTAFAFTACDDDQQPLNGYVSQTQSGSKTMVLKGYTGYQEGYNTLIPDSCTHPFYINRPTEGIPQFYGEYYDFWPAEEKKLEDMKEIPSVSLVGWQGTTDIIAGQCYWVKYYDTSVYRFIKLRVDYIDGNNVGVEYITCSETEERPNENMNANYEISDISAAYELEIPHLDTRNFFAPHYVSYNNQDIMNLAIEWNSSLKHANWVAYYFDSTTSQDNVSRGDDWKWDPEIPTSYGAVYESNHKSDGYDKGHLCASEDRVYCQDANNQTFMYSNISPQIGVFNQQFWNKLESLIQKWGRMTIGGTYDKVYITKGGTLNNLLKNFTGTKKANDGYYPTADANGLSKGGLAVPAYYYMAILAEKNGKYLAIGFLVPHSEALPGSPTTTQLQSYTCSIDYLEEKTGLDFFCNLEDNVEDEVEKSFNFVDWAW